MTLLRRYIIVFYCLVMITQYSDAGLSVNVLDLMATVNGIYASTDKGAVSSLLYTKIQIKVLPVSVPALSKNPMVYIELATNDDALVIIVAKVKETQGSPRFSLLIYLFADPKLYKFGSFKTETLANFKTTDFVQDPANCLQEWTLVSEGNYTGSMSICLYPPVKHLKFAVKCDSMTVLITNGTKETSVRQPRVLTRQQKKFPMLGAQRGYVNPCGQSQ